MNVIKKILGFKPDQSDRDSYNAKVRILNKHLRIVAATKNLNERQIHLQKAENLIKKHNLKPL